MRHRTALMLAGLLAAGAALTAAPDRPARQAEWKALRSPGFHVLGNAGERDLRRVAERLEQFREAFGLLFPKAVRAASRPITVIVFRNHKSFDPFKPVRDGKPLAHLAGFFQAGRAVDYVALTIEGGFDYGIIYHEYVHVLVNGVVGTVPVWFGEGLAEYYRTFEVVGRRRANLGGVIDGHVWLLREQWLPLATLLAVTHDSPHYNESNKASVFYAESWALVHYLLLGENQKYTKRVASFLHQLEQGATPEEACANALQVPLSVLERDLRRYVEQSVFARQTATFTGRIADLGRVPVTPLSEADAHATLGDLLLLQTGRADDARAQLEMALGLDASHAQAHASMGRLLLEAGQRDEALRHLERAVSGTGAGWLTHYAYASALQESRGAGPAGSLDGAIEGALRRVIELNPDFAESYAQLAWLKMREPIPPDAEIDALVRAALERAPGDDRYAYLRASVLMQRRRTDEARPLFQRLTRSRDEWLRRAAGDALQRIEHGQSPLGPGAPPDLTESDSSATGSTFVPAFRTPAAGEARIAGFLAAIDCGAEGVSLAIAVKGEPARVRVVRLEDVEFITYRAELAGRVTCGARETPEPVVVSYRPAAEGAGVLGDAVAVEFLPDGYELPR